MAQMEELKANIQKGQQLWMLQQGKLVELSKDLESKSMTMRKLQTQYTAMKQKKIYLESKNSIKHEENHQSSHFLLIFTCLTLKSSLPGQIEQEERENSELEKNSKILEQDLKKLSVLLHKNQHLSQALEQENTIMETDFIHQIKARHAFILIIRVLSQYFKSLNKFEMSSSGERVEVCQHPNES